MVQDAQSIRANQPDSVSSERGAFAGFIARFTLARILLFGALLLAALIGLQIGISFVAHQIPRPVRPLWSLPAELLYGALMLWVYCTLVRYFERREVQELARRGAARRVAAGALLGAVLFSIVYAVMALSGYLHQVRFAGFAGFWSPLATAIGAGVGEELVFRGVIFRMTEERLGTAAALIVSSLLFGLVHAINVGATPVSTAAIALEAGALLGIAYSASRSLWLPIGLHFGWNFTEGGIFGTAVSGGQSRGLLDSVLSGPNLMTGGSFGPEASLIAVVVSLTATVTIGLWAVRHGRWRPWNPRRP
jgi:uncharacterized protein